MGILESLGWSTASQDQSYSLAETFELLVKEQDFISTDIINIYSRILTDVIERTQGISDDLVPLLWDNCLETEVKDGLITMLAKAMVYKKDLFIVYNKPLKLILEAKPEEQSQIKKDYREKGESPIGIYISFRSLRKTDMLKIYSALEYCTVLSLHKSMNVSKSLQYKMDSLRSSVGFSDSAMVLAQAAEISKAISNGKDVILDGKDSIDVSVPDLESAQKSMDFIAQKQSFYLGLPASYITGLQSNGLGDNAEKDTKAVERGLRSYYFSIIKPVIETLFAISTSFKTDDQTSIDTGLNALKTFELTDDSLISIEDKKTIISRLFGLSKDGNNL